MRYYIAYKFLDADKELLKKNLGTLCSKLENGNNSTFIFYRDTQNRGAIKIPDHVSVSQLGDAIKHAAYVVF